MPFTNIELETLECGTKKYIEVDQPIAKVLQKGDQIRFFNKLKGNPEATIRFYPLDSKGVGEIGGFCTEMTGTTLPVPGTGAPTTCTTTIDGNFSYTVEASPSHEMLDPIIIIDPSYDFSAKPMMPGPDIGAGLPGTGVLFAMAAALFLGGLIGIFAGRKMR